jgi:hypothetical protein
VARLVCSRALGWLGQARAKFALPAGVVAEQVPTKAMKSLGELGLAMSLVVREAVAGAEDARLARALLDFAWDQLDQGGLLYRRQLHDPAKSVPMEVYAPFARAGYRHQQLMELCEYLCSLRAARVRELVPNRQLAVVAAARQLGLPAPVDPLVLAERTWLGGRPEPWMLTPANAYALTHTVFYLTDFGADPGGLPEELQEYLHTWLPVWVDVFTETQAWDLLAELLIVDACLSTPMSYPHAWEQFAQAQYCDGMVPNGITRVPSDLSKAFGNHHHPTLVAVIAGTLTVSRMVGAAR